MKDQESIARLRQGDLNGLKGLVERYQVRAVRIAFLILFDRSAAEDIVQSSFIKISERIHQYDDKRPFAPWFYRIVINDAVKLARKQERLVSIDHLVDESTAKLTTWLAAPSSNPELQLEEDETRQFILNAIRNLPPDQRAVIVLRYYLDMSEFEMSLKFGRPLSTIKWWLRDGRKRLRNLMKPNPIVEE